MMKTLHMAAAVGNLDIVRFLVGMGINVNDADDSHLPLHEAIMNSRLDVVEYLIDEGADVCAKNAGNETMLHYAVDYSNKIEIAERLISAGVSVNAADFTGLTPLHCATRCHWPDMVELLCANGADPEARDEEGKTPLHVAAYQDSSFCAHYLIVKMNVALDSKTKNGVTPFATAVKYANSTVAHLLVAAGYRPMPKDCCDMGSDMDPSDHKLCHRDKDCHEKLLKMTRHVVSMVPSLQDVCVFKVRRLLGRTVLTSVNSLQVPEILRNRISLTHVTLKQEVG